MPRSTLFITLLKKLIESASYDRERFYQSIEEIRSQMGLLNDGERFDLEMNLKSEIKSYEEKRDV